MVDSRAEVGQNNKHTASNGFVVLLGQSQVLNNARKVFCFDDRFEYSPGQIPNGDNRFGSPVGSASGIGHPFEEAADSKKTGQFKDIEGAG
ncbi:MAG: hypothetical protein ACKV2U_27725 [Bryobacteraceae bacterium]